MKQIKLSGKGQITIPVKIQKKLGLEKGDVLEIMIKDDDIVLVPRNKPMTSIKGIFKKPDFLKDMTIEEIISDSGK